MRAVALSIHTGELVSRIRARLSAEERAARAVVWQRDGQSVAIRLDRVNARLLEGWLLVAVELSTRETKRQSLELVYRLGTRERGGGTGAAVKINAASPEALALAELWGADLQRVVWDAVLDVVEAAVRDVQTKNPRDPVRPRGFRAARDTLTVDLAIGAR